MLKTPQPTPPDSLKQAHVSNDIIVSIPPMSIPSDDPPQSQKEEEKITKQDLLNYVLPLYKAALDGDWDKAEDVFKVDNKWMTAKITKHGDTVLHIAAAAMHLDFVKKLASRMHKNNVPLDSKNVHGNTAFCNAASSGNVEIAQVMVEFDKELPNIRSSGAKKLTPLHMAILLGKRDMVNYLNDDNVTDPKRLTDEDRIELLTSAIEAGLYDIALDFIQKYPSLALQRNSKDETVLHTLAAQRPLKNSTRKQIIWDKLLRRCHCKNTGNKENEQDLKNNALEVTRIAWKKVVEKEDVSEHINTPWRLLFVAAKRGNAGFLRTLIKIYPDIIWKVDEKGRSIFHIAVQYRHEEIFKLIHEFGTIKDFIATYKDDNGNNMLHLAAKLPPPDILNCISGAALQMQRELLWFEAVRKVVQPQYALANNHENLQNDEDRSKSLKSVQNDKKNSEYRNQEDDIIYEDDDISDFGMTPQALFTKQHEDLRSRGEAWMKKTAESCTLVATLITTVIFTAAFTLPGGNDQNNGSPILLNHVCFKVFAIFNAFALFASSTSIFTFLSILTSRYAEKDFLVVLPRKLMAGLTSLFFSIVFMMAAFTATFFITFLRNPIWIPAPIPVLAAIPVVLFLYQQSSLLWDIYSSKNKSWTLIQPSDKRTLFWSSKSPKIMSNKKEKTSYKRQHNKLE